MTDESFYRRSTTKEKSLDCHLFLWREGKDQVVEFFLDLNKLYCTQ